MRLPLWQGNRIWQLACTLEPDPDRVLDWWYNETLVTLDGLTPCELLEQGRGDELEAYLTAICADALE